MRYLAYALGFLVEIAAWVGCGAIALLLLSGIQAWTFGAVITGGVIALWGMLMAPKAPKRLPLTAYYVVKAVIYLWAVAGWWQVSPWAAAAFVAAAAVAEPLMFRFQQAVDQPGPGPT